MRNKLIYWSIWVLVLLIIFLCVSIFSLCVGSANISFKKIFSLIFDGKNSTEGAIIFNIRLPRIILGFAIGGALSLAGVILQGMFGNPLVEPYTLGISGGAALGVCLNIILKLNSKVGILSIPIFGFLGAVLVILLVYFLSLRKGVLRTQGLLLTGVMISFIASSLIMLLMAISGIEDLHGIIFWIMGSLEEPNWILIKLILSLSICGLVVSYLFCFELNAFSLGEEEALHLGINVERTKKFLFLLASLLAGFSVSVAGVIGFVGLVVPHFMRMFVGRDHRILLVSSFLGGASFLIFSDTIARTIISPLELPVGVITGIIGGSIFIYTLTKKDLF
ncbi:MAG: iron ABC transporter permease [Candidatus Omnitrophica bacterium]|nr:iron ABC transporter permease [Candidatus Omnitrophota bacterium]